MKSVDKIIKLAAIFQKKIATGESEAIKMLNWVINDSPIQFGKKEAREILDFLDKKQEQSPSRFDEKNIGLIPDASKVDRVGAALTVYFYSVYGNNPGLHNHLVKNIDNLLDAFGQYESILNTNSEDLVSRWEKAISNVANAPEDLKKNILSRYSYAPGLAEALLEAANKLKRR